MELNNNKFIEQLLAQLDGMLLPDEKSLCPTWCIFKPTGFFSHPSDMRSGFITVTDRKRVLVISQKLFAPKLAAYDLATVSDFKITNMPLKQKALSMVFLENGKKVKLKLQAAPKVLGSSLPEQADNLEHLIVLLSRHGA